MKELSKLMDFRPSIKVLDATLRDGGLVNDFRFSDEFTKALYKANVKAGVDYMEFGYKADKDMFDEKKFGKWKFCKDDDIRAIVGDNNTDLKIAVMADVGRCNFKRDILPKSESPIHMIRVATYCHTIPSAIEIIEDAKEKGYEVTCNIMAISTNQESDIKVALDLLGKSNVDCIYLVDSFGSIYPEAMERAAKIYTDAGEKYGKAIGIHAHNNMQLAFANTIECCGDGIDYLDATFAGMGRGAGNCAMELLLGFLKNPKYNVFPVIDFIDKFIPQVKKDGAVWGFDWNYMITGQLNQHPRTAIQFSKDGRTDYANFYKEITSEE